MTCCKLSLTSAHFISSYDGYATANGRLSLIRSSSTSAIAIKSSTHFCVKELYNHYRTEARELPTCWYERIATELFSSKVAWRLRVMFGIDELLSRDNQEIALASFRAKRDGAGPDGMRVSELDDYWKANHEILERRIREGTYVPGIVKCFEVSTRSVKQREIASINVADRFVEKLIQLKLREYVEPMFLPHSFAYQESKSTLDAAMLVRDYVVAGKPFLCELDIKDYFGSIHLGRLRKLASKVLDKDVANLIWIFLTREVERDGKIERIAKGILQGSAISPALANLYLHGFDEFMEERGLCWLRFSDNIDVCCETSDEASKVYEYLRDELGQVHQLALNKKKSGVYRAVDRRILGYDLVEGPCASVEVRRHTYRPVHVQSRWSSSIVRKSHGAYHIVKDGVINRKDYSLLFENDDEKHHIPVGVTDQLNIYGNVTVSPAALATITRENIRIAYLDEYGVLMGTYVPEAHGKAADVFLKQCAIYNDAAKRLDVARRLEIASIHNMRENLRYYVRRGREALVDHVSYLSSCVTGANEARDVDGLMLVEARARKKYYEGFSMVVEAAGFSFARRSKRPPKDPCNALISFGNTVMYNEVLQIIWKTSLDPKIGVVHATNRRNYSLNLDFADLFKPVVVDRTIFALINRHQIKAETHFRTVKAGGVLLNTEGKRLFLDALEQKLDSRVAGKGSAKGRRLTYRQLIVNEVEAFQRLVRDGEVYKPYKYY